MTYIKFETQTYAYKASELLKTKGIMSKIKRNPNPDHREGCNYALFTSSDIGKAYELINSYKIPNMGIEKFG